MIQCGKPRAGPDRKDRRPTLIIPLLSFVIGLGGWKTLTGGKSIRGKVGVNRRKPGMKLALAELCDSMPRDMPHKFDAANKHLLETYPADWIALAGLPPGSAVHVVDGDLSAVSASADKLIRVDATQPYIAHFEPQAGPEADLDQRILVYTVMAWRRLKLPVLSVVLLLRPAALTPEVTGRISVNWSPEHELKFGYKMVRVWELPVKLVLEGGVGTLPLAPIAAVKKMELPAVIDAMKRRLDHEVPPEEARDVWTATGILMGLRYSREAVSVLLKGVANMEESTTYQEIIEKGMERGLARGLETGRLAEGRSILMRRGSKRLGAPSPHIEAALNAITDINKLEDLVDRLIDGGAKTWDELLS